MRKKIILVLSFILISNFLAPAHSSEFPTRTLNICSNPYSATNPPCIEKFWAFGTDHTSSFGGGNSLTSPFQMSVSYTNFFGIQVGIGTSQGFGTPDPSTISVENRYVEVILNLGTAAENNNFVSGYAGNYSSNGYYAISSGELTSLSHSISYPLTLHFNIPHGLACIFTVPSIFSLFKASLDLSDNEIAELEFLLKILKNFDISSLINPYLNDLDIFSLVPEMKTNRSENFFMIVDEFLITEILAKSLDN